MALRFDFGFPIDDAPTSKKRDEASSLFNSYRLHMVVLLSRRQFKHASALTRR